MAHLLKLIKDRHLVLKNWVLKRKKREVWQDRWSLSSQLFGLLDLLLNNNRWKTQITTKIQSKNNPLSKISVSLIKVTIKLLLSCFHLKSCLKHRKRNNNIMINSISELAVTVESWKKSTCLIQHLKLSSNKIKQALELRLLLGRVAIIMVEKAKNQTWINSLLMSIYQPNICKIVKLLPGKSLRMKILKNSLQ